MLYGLIDGIGDIRGEFLCQSTACNYNYYNNNAGVMGRGEKELPTTTINRRISSSSVPDRMGQWDTWDGKLGV